MVKRIRVGVGGLQTAGSEARFSARKLNISIMNGTSSSCSNDSFTCSRRIGGTNGRNDSRRLIFG